MRILLVEDNLLIAMMFEQTLSELGHEVLQTVTTFKEALAAARKLKPDIACVDYGLADGHTGGHLAEQLTSEGLCPVVFVTGNAELASQHLRAAEGMLVKPVEPNDLHSTITAVDQRRRGEPARFPPAFLPFFEG